MLLKLKQGRAYLFNSVVNIGCGQAEERVLLTGLLIYLKGKVLSTYTLGSCYRTRPVNETPLP
jgi:hypothetical protein